MDYTCTRCGKHLMVCDCPDLPDESLGGVYWGHLNRIAEEWARWLRALGLLAAVIFFAWWTQPTHATNLNGQWDNSPYAAWYKKQVPTPETRKAYDIEWVSCCDVGDVCQSCVVYRVTDKPPYSDGWYYLKDGALTQLPPHIVHYVPWTPTGKPVLFIAPFGAGKMQKGDPVCLKIPGGAT